MRFRLLIEGFLLVSLIFQAEGLNVNLHLYTRSNPTVPTIIQSEKDFNTSKPVKVLIHGWLDSYVQVYADMKHSYLRKEDCNVIMVDWLKPNGGYSTSSVYIRHIGYFLGDTIFNFFKNFQMVHLVGFDVGAHIAGFAGKRLASFTDYKSKIGRITGLSPTLPLFNGTEPEKRLNKNDALIVDVVHCDIYRMGFGDALGTVDFYPNGGVYPQPGCDDANPTLDMYFSPWYKSFCSHARCRDYFMMSITNQSIIATKCDSYEDYLSGKCEYNEQVVFGEELSEGPEAKYYFNITISEQ